MAHWKMISKRPFKTNTILVLAHMEWGLFKSWDGSTLLSLRHLDTHHVLLFAKWYFWWPSMTQGIKNFVSACPTCARNKCNNQSPAGLLQPLWTPRHPWFHITPDFITGLFATEGNSIILFIIDCFYTSAHFVLLPKLPSALPDSWYSTFQLLGIPIDFASDRGPQFIWQM